MVGGVGGVENAIAHILVRQASQSPPFAVIKPALSLPQGYCGGVRVVVRPGERARPWPVQDAKADAGHALGVHTPKARDSPHQPS